MGADEARSTRDKNSHTFKRVAIAPDHILRYNSAMRFEQTLIDKERKALLLKIITWAQKEKKQVEKLSRSDIIEALRWKMSL